MITSFNHKGAGRTGHRGEEEPRMTQMTRMGTGEPGRLCHSERK